jgi:peptidyl-prolyl cis-trans isomerase SurA
MTFRIIIFLLFSTTIFGQITKKELDDVLPVAEIVQPEPVVVSIGKKTFTLKDFNQLYKRNIQTDTLPEKSPKQFLDQFIATQLKISKAEKDGIDTTTAFKEELATLKRELTASFLTEKSVNDALIKEAYERLETEVNVAHILVAVDEFASPDDTLIAFNSITEIRNSLLNGEKFNEAAKKYSNDSSANKDEGNLGYITAFQTVYDFESMAYKTPVGKISSPFRTKHGYHIIKSIAKREFQRWKVAHIFVAVNSNSSENIQVAAKRKIDQVYNALQQGDNFEKTAIQFSEDATTNLKGGVFNRLFGTDELEKPFEDALFSLKKNGAYSTPILTSRGWHIVRMIEKQELKPFVEMYNFLQNKVAADSRSELTKKALVQRVKKENSFKQYQSVIDDSKYLIDSLLVANQSINKITNELSKKVIFAIGQKDILATKFFDFAKNKWTKSNKKYNKYLTTLWYNEFESLENINYEEEVLPEKNEEFRQLINEYREGILLQNVSGDQFVAKIIQDNAAQKDFYGKNLSKYLLPERMKVEVIDANSQQNLMKAKDIFSKSPYSISLKWNDLIFNVNNADLSENHMEHLTNLSLLLLKNLDYKIEISGNIDPDETEVISSERAQNVVKYLTSKGVALERIIEKDNGKFQPLSKTEREKNRRVSFAISTTNKQDVVKLNNALKPESLKVLSGYFKKGENKTIDQLKWVAGEQQIEKSGRYIFANVENVEPGRTMTFEEAKGKVIKAILTEKEKELVEKLEKMFPVVVNEEQLKKVSK